MAVAVKVPPVDPLNHDVPIVDERGRPTPQFMQQWLKARNISLTVDESALAVEDLYAALANKSDIGHTHDERYYTEAEIDALETELINAIAAAMENTSAVNVGGQSNVFKEQVGDELRFRTIKAGANITVTQTADTIDISAAGGAVRASPNFTTAVLGIGATESGAFNIATKTAIPLVITADKACYIVLYASSAARDADARPLPATTDASAGTGVLGEFAFGAGGGTIPISPTNPYYNQLGTSTNIYYRIYNAQGVANAITVTLTLLPMEA
jgi:hypothetical protein